jgi:hypothetical protein
MPSQQGVCQVRGEGLIRVGCIEKRLNRKLQPSDFVIGNNGYNIPDLATKRLLSCFLPRGVRRKILGDNRGKQITMTLQPENYAHRV